MVQARAGWHDADYDTGAHKGEWNSDEELGGTSGTARACDWRGAGPAIVTIRFHPRTIRGAYETDRHALQGIAEDQVRLSQGCEWKTDHEDATGRRVPELSRCAGALSRAKEKDDSGPG